MNEHQLAIAESTTSQREELKVDMSLCKQIMTVEQAQAYRIKLLELLIKIIRP